MQEIVIHFLVFTGVAVILLMVPLTIGKLLRPKLPTPEKEAVYECGEPTIGTSYIQFDLRFYVVALLFIIFDVEVAFFFPWATVFGGATQLADDRVSSEARIAVSEKLLNQPAGTLAAENAIQAGDGMLLATTALVDILVFFGVLLVGFAYVWKRGDLDWVRAMTQEAKEEAAPPMSPPGYTPDSASPLPPDREREPLGV